MSNNDKYLNERYLKMLHNDINDDEAKRLLKYVQSKGIIFKTQYTPMQYRLWMANQSN